MKRSLHIGINDYPGTGSDLAGCVNDANAWKAELAKRGFKWQDVLLDKQAFKKAMTDAIADIVVATQAGDLTVITYSGHGSWVPDYDGDEPDGRDEALCPWDLDQGLLTDDYLYSIFKEVASEAKVIFISDSCHSGSVARHAPRISGPFVNAPLVPRVKFLPPSMHLTKDGIESAHKVAGSPVRGRSRETPVLLMSGCKDDEYSYDAFFDGHPCGAFTHTALWTLAKLPELGTYKQWHDAIRSYLPHDQYPQTPLISGPDELMNSVVFS
jgi:hypothetical protein